MSSWPIIEAARAEPSAQRRTNAWRRESAQAHLNFYSEQLLRKMGHQVSTNEPTNVSPISMYFFQLRRAYPVPREAELARLLLTLLPVGLRAICLLLSARGAVGAGTGGQKLLRPPPHPP
jgi:hypothetical protein